MEVRRDKRRSFRVIDRKVRETKNKVYFDANSKPIGLGEVTEVDVKVKVGRRVVGITQTIRAGSGRMSEVATEVDERTARKLKDPNDPLKLKDIKPPVVDQKPKKDQ